MWGSGAVPPWINEIYGFQGIFGKKIETPSGKYAPGLVLTFKNNVIMLILLIYLPYPRV